VSDAGASGKLVGEALHEIVTRVLVRKHLRATELANRRERLLVAGAPLTRSKTSRVHRRGTTSEITATIAFVRVSTTVALPRTGAAMSLS